MIRGSRKPSNSSRHNLLILFIMKKSKVMIPVMTLGLAVGLAFANTATVANGWINVNGVPTQLSSDPCDNGAEECSVIFENDPQQQIYEVYTDMSLTTRKPSGTGTPLLVPGTP
ncbi:DUF6520 family protein, partial [Leeuwenhoekiella marinoflava]|uniref:DUF6520 family protein n=1 Tax=Leeuwenhoekiella marinoflava TaxID=988 RepID=UPI0030025D61